MDQGPFELTWLLGPTTELAQQGTGAPSGVDQAHLSSPGCWGPEWSSPSRVDQGPFELTWYWGPQWSSPSHWGQTAHPVVRGPTELARTGAQRAHPVLDWGPEELTQSWTGARNGHTQCTGASNQAHPVNPTYNYKPTGLDVVRQDLTVLGLKV